MVHETGRRGPQTVTIADVAREAGVSAMTVSRVVNNVHVSAKSRTAILAAIAKLAYEPNSAARTLAGTRPIRIGLPYDNPSATYLSAFLLGALDHAQKAHSQLIVVKCGADDHKEEVIRSLLNNNIDGILLPPPLSDSVRIRTIISQFAMPAIAVGGGADTGNASSVRIDDFCAAVAMTEHLLALGHRRIGFIKGNPNQMSTACRLSGYRAALVKASLPDDPRLIEQGDFTYRSGLIAADALLNLAHPPTAIFASNDDMAAATVAAAHRRHMDVPADLTVCGFDDTLFAQSIWPELTTIHQPISEMARVAIDTLLSAIRTVRRGEKSMPAHTVLDYALVRRNSDGPPRS